MRLLHTSDWHLGQDFYGFDRIYEQKKFLSGLASTLEQTKTDVLLIAGDVFDVPNPPAEAQKMFFEFLVDVKRRCPSLQTVLIAGNHDSGSRLEAPAQILKSMDVSVVGRIKSTPDGIEAFDNRFLIPLFRAGDEKNQPAAICVALPYLRSSDMQWPGDGIRPYPETVLRTYQQAITMARAQYGDAIPLIGMGHLHARGGASSKDSERPIIIGGEEAVPLSSLAEHFAYVGLGHLHLAQSVGQHEHIRYSGSPLVMSFSEIHYKHQLNLVDLKHDGSIVQESLLIERPVKFFRCPTKPADISEVTQHLKNLNLEELPQADWPYLEVQVLVSGPTPDIPARVEEALADKPIRRTKISYSRPESKEDQELRPGSGTANLATLGRLEPLAVFEEMHRRKYNLAPDQDLLKVFQDALHDVLHEAKDGGEK